MPNLHWSTTCCPVGSVGFRTITFSELRLQARSFGRHLIFSHCGPLLVLQIRDTSTSLSNFTSHTKYDERRPRLGGEANRVQGLCELCLRHSPPRCFSTSAIRASGPEEPQDLGDTLHGRLPGAAPIAWPQESSGCHRASAFAVPVESRGLLGYRGSS